MKKTAESRPTKKVRTRETSQIGGSERAGIDVVVEGERDVEPEVAQGQSDASTGYLAAIEAAKQAISLERQALYEKMPTAERKRGKRKVDEIETALDDMINARSRSEIKCSRLPATVYFVQSKHGASHLAA